MSFQVPVEQVLAVLLVAIRVSAWLVVAPPFNSRAIPSLVKVAIAVAVALPIGPRLSGQAPSPEVFPVVLAALFQVVVGLTLGFLAQLLFSAVQPPVSWSTWRAASRWPRCTTPCPTSAAACSAGCTS